MATDVPLRAAPAALALAVLVSLLPLAGRAGPGARGATAPPATAFYVWYDGGRPRTVWLDPTLLAEFGPATGAAPDGTRSAAEMGEAVRLFSLEPGQDLDAVLSKARAARRGNRYSPVLRDGRSSGRRRALPGNVVVDLAPALDEASARSWAAGQGLEIVARFPVGPSSWVVRSEPGLAALELANALAAVPGVAGASPVWWVETVTR